MSDPPSQGKITKDMVQVSKHCALVFHRYHGALLCIHYHEEHVVALTIAGPVDARETAECVPVLIAPRFVEVM